MQRERQHSTKPRSALTALDAHAHAGTSVDDDDVGAERRRARDDDVLSVCRRSGRMARLAGWLADDDDRCCSLNVVPKRVYADMYAVG